MMKPQSGCPAGWSENGYVFQGTYPSQTNNKSTSLHMKGHIADNYVIRTFCLNNQLSSPKWPKGISSIESCLSRDDASMIAMLFKTMIATFLMMAVLMMTIVMMIVYYNQCRFRTSRIKQCCIVSYFLRKHLHLMPCRSCIVIYRFSLMQKRL